MIRQLLYSFFLLSVFHPELVCTFLGHTSSVLTFNYFLYPTDSPFSIFMITAGVDSTIRLWNFSSQHSPYSQACKTPLQSHTNASFKTAFNLIKIRQYVATIEIKPQNSGRRLSDNARRDTGSGSMPGSPKLLKLQRAQTFLTTEPKFRRKETKKVRVTGAV